MENANYRTSWGKILASWAYFLLVIILIGPFIKPLGMLYGLIVQELIVVIGTLLLNYYWIHQPLHFRTDVPAKTLWGVNTLSIIFAIIAIVSAISRNAGNVILISAVVGVCAGITEELVFRGVILPGTMTHFSGHRGMWYAVLITSALFGVSHMVNLARQPLEATLLQGVNAFAMGLFLAALYLRTRSLIFPMIFHGLNDFISTLSLHGHINMANRSFAPYIGQWLLYLAVALFLLRKSKTEDVYKITEKDDR